MPNFLKRFFPKAESKSFLTGVQSFMSYFEDNAKPTSRDYLDAYEASWVVYACVRKIAEQTALSTELRLYKLKGKDNVDEIDDHDLLDLLAKFNPRLTRFEAIDLTQTHLELLGNAYWLKVRAEDGKSILQIEILRPDWVTVKFNDNNTRYYEYRPMGGDNLIFQEADVIHFITPNPKSSTYGLPIIKPALELIKTSVYLTRMQMNTFLNNARPDFLLFSKTSISDDEKKEFRKTWNATFQGLDKVNKYGIFTGELEFKEVNRKFSDLGLNELNEQLVDHILGAFGVPRSVLGLKGMNRAEAESQLEAFMSGVIEPKIKRMVEKVNEFLVPDFGIDLYIDYDDPVPENRELVLKEYENAIKNNWMTVNEVRDKEGLPPIEGGWDIYAPITMIPVKDIADGDNVKADDTAKSAYPLLKLGHMTQKKYEEHKTKEFKKRIYRKASEGKRIYKAFERFKKEVAPAMATLLKGVRANTPKALTADMKEKIWGEHDKALIRDEKLFSRLVRSLFRNQKQRAAEAVKEQFGGGAVPHDKSLLNWGVEKELFKQASQPVYMQIYKERGEAQDQRLNKNFTVDEKVLEAILAKAFKFADYVNATTAELIREALVEGVDAGEGIAEIGRRVNAIFNKRLERFQVERIARTEVLGASNEAALLSMKQSGVVKKKEWLATLDGRTRESHAHLNGEIVDLEKEFSNGLKYAGDPNGAAEEVINCRCAVIEVID
jgi:HK97 family phage portal protein